MIEYLTEIITEYWNYYYLLIVISFVIGLLASYHHNTGFPIMFSSILGIIMYYGFNYLNIMVLGVNYYDHSILGIMLSIFSIIWLLIYAISHYNLIVYGRVVK